MPAGPKATSATGSQGQHLRAGARGLTGLEASVRRTRAPEGNTQVPPVPPRGHQEAGQRDVLQLGWRGISWGERGPQRPPCSGPGVPQHRLWPPARPSGSPAPAQLSPLSQGPQGTPPWLGGRRMHRCLTRCVPRGWPCSLCLGGRWSRLPPSGQVSLSGWHRPPMQPRRVLLPQPWPESRGGNGVAPSPVNSGMPPGLPPPWLWHR